MSRRSTKILLLTKVTLIKSILRLGGKCLEAMEPDITFSLDFLVVRVDYAWPRPVSHCLGEVKHFS